MPRRPNRPSSRPPTPVYTPPAGTLTYHKLIKDMSPDDLVNWLTGKQAWLTQKMQRERDYLNRRANRRVHTPTDEAYEADQAQEQELLALLEELLQGAQAQGVQIP